MDIVVGHVRTLPFLLSAVLALVLGSIAASADAAQAQTRAIRVEVVESTMPVAGVTVSAGGRSAVTDAFGIATLMLPAEPVSVVATKNGYEPATARLDLTESDERVVRLSLITHPSAPTQPTAQTQSTIVASTRTGLSAEDQAVPVAVIDRKTIDEQMMMAPGTIVNLLDAMSGLRVQTTSPELGTAMVRIRGLRAHYTRLLFDGVPLYWDHPGGLTTVHIPPMDLDRIEVVKGASSALYGPNAMAGVVNLISRRPGPEPTREVLFSQSARGTTDAALWLATASAGPAKTWSSTFLASAHSQNETDGDDDGWSDLPDYKRIVLRPRVLWDNGRGRSASGTAGVTFETREGGSLAVRQSLESRGADGALFGQMILGNGNVLAGGATLFAESRTREFSDGREHERREAATIEISLRGSATRHTWVAGIAADWYALRSHDVIPSTYSSTIGSIFVHDDMNVADWLSVSGTARIDHHILHGFFLSPQGSARVRRGSWSAGISAGRAFYAPTALTEETEAAGVARLKVDGPLHVETGRSAAADVMYETRAAAMTFTLFQSRVDHPAIVNRATYTLRSSDDPIETRGIELLGTVRRAPIVVTGTYTYVHARHGGQDVTLTPRQSAGVAASVGTEGRGRIGVEVTFTGTQRLDANPFRSTSASYVVTNLFAERPVGRVRVFVNAMNLTDVRQTDWDPIARPTRDVDGRWTVDAWAPLAGRVINAGLRIAF